MPKLKTFLRNLFLRQKTYLYCVSCMISIPLVHLFWHELSFEFMYGAEMFLGVTIFIRHALSKIQGHNLRDKI